MTKLLKTALKSMSERQTDRHKYKGERKRDVYESLPVNSFEHNEVVHSKRFQRKRIRTY